MAATQSAGHSMSENLGRKQPTMFCRVALKCLIDLWKCYSVSGITGSIRRGVASRKAE